MRFIIIIGLMVMCSGLSAQSTFNVVYNHSIEQSWPDPEGGLGYAVHQTDSGYRVFGGQVSSNNFTKPFVADFDDQGLFITDTEHFSSTYMHGEYGDHECVTDTSFPVSTFITEWDSAYNSTNVHLTMVGTNGDTVSSILIQDTGRVSIKQTIITANGLAAGVGMYLNMYSDTVITALLLVTDMNGSIVLNSQFGPGDIRRVVEYLDDGYILTGRDYSNAVDRGMIIRTDSLGNEIWRKNYGGWGAIYSGIHVYGNGNILIGTSYQTPGQPFDDYTSRLIKYDAQGNLLLQEDFLTAPRSWFIDFEVLPGGNIIAIGNYSDPLLPNPYRRAYIANLSATGQLLWSRFPYFFDAFLGANYVKDLTVTTDGGFIVTGESRADTTTQYQGLQMTWLFKTDSLGCVVPGCQYVGIEEQEEKALRIFPNPFDNEIKVDADVEFIELFDMTGRLIRFAASNKLTDLEDLPKAVYLVRAGSMYARVVKQ